MTLSVDIIDDAAQLGATEDAWDSLAVETERPFCSPAWMLAWWRHARPSDSALRIVTVHDGNRLVGLAPLWTMDAGPTQPSAFEVLTDRLSPPVGPLAAVGREREVATKLTEALAKSRRRGMFLRLWDKFGPGDLSRMVVEAWPDPAPWVHTAVTMRAPVVPLGGLDYEAWLGAKSSKFRQGARRRQRRLEELGARFVTATPATFARSLQALLDLHARRWDGKGGSSALVGGLRPMLEAAATELLPRGRMRLLTIEAGNDVIAGNLLIAAGGQASGWLSGFDPSWGRHSPSFQLLLYAIADATARRETRFDLGPGDSDYKRRLTGEQQAISGLTMVPRGGSYSLVRASLLGYQARWALSARLSVDTKAHLRRLVRR
jgi:CelD/BcsL family acetyltransferase involved in cellulose biosynthesis